MSITYQPLEYQGRQVQKEIQIGQHIINTVYGEESIAPGLQSFALGHYEHRHTAQGTAPTLVSEYIYLPTPTGPMPIAAEINGRLYAIHTDQLNTPRQLTDENGQEVWQWAISGFGEAEATTAQTGWIRARNGSAGQISNTLPVTFNLRFPGQQFDEETGLHYNHHRYYDPYLTVGYTEADPLGLAAGWNRFVYAEGSPLLYVDSDGRHPIIIGAAVGAAIGSYIAYKLYRYKSCLNECTICTNHHLNDECDYSCKPPREDGNTGPFYSCSTMCIYKEAPGAPSLPRSK